MIETTAGGIASSQNDAGSKTLEAGGALRRDTQCVAVAAAAVVVVVVVVLAAVVLAPAAVACFCLPFLLLLLLLLLLSTSLLLLLKRFSLQSILCFAHCCSSVVVDGDVVAAAATICEDDDVAACLIKLFCLPLLALFHFAVFLLCDRPYYLIIISSICSINDDDNNNNKYNNRNKCLVAVSCVFACITFVQQIMVHLTMYSLEQYRNVSTESPKMVVNVYRSFLKHKQQQTRGYLASICSPQPRKT